MHYPIIRRSVACLGFAAVVTAAVVGCSSSNNSSSSSSSSSAATSASAVAAAPAPAAGAPSSSDPAVQAITTTFTTFFNPKTAAAAKAGLLENGQQFAPVIAAQANNPMSANTSATVSTVQLTDPGHAAVTYTVLMNGSPVLPNQAGKAVLDNGQWKVADSTFCALLAMQGPAPAACTAH